MILQQLDEEILSEIWVADQSCLHKFIGYISSYFCFLLFSGCYAILAYSQGSQTSTFQDTKHWQVIYSSILELCLGCMLVVDQSSTLQGFSKLYIASPFFFDMFVVVYYSEVVGSFVTCHCYALCFCLSLLIVNSLSISRIYRFFHSRNLVCGIL